MTAPLLALWLREALSPQPSPALGQRILEAGGGKADGHPAADWQALFTRAHAQGIAPLLHASLDRWGLAEALGAQAAPFARAHGATLRQNIIHLAELARMTRALEREGVAGILLKGAAFLGEIYPHPALRPMCDIDLLVRPGDVRRTLGILGRIGYAPLRPGMAEALLRTNNEIGLARRLPDGTVVYTEVHWRLIPAESLVEGPAQEPAGIWKRSRPCRDPQLRARVLSDNDALLFSAIHLQRHVYSRALWFVDLALLMATRRINWASVLREARAWKAEPALFTALAGTGALCGVSAPGNVMASIRPGKLRAAALGAILDWKTMFGPRAAQGEHTLPPSRRYLLKLLQARDTLAALGSAGRMIYPSREWLRARYGIEGAALPPGVRRRHIADAFRAVMGFQERSRALATGHRLTDATAAD